MTLRSPRSAPLRTRAFVTLALLTATATVASAQPAPAAPVAAEPAPAEPAPAAPVVAEPATPAVAAPALAPAVAAEPIVPPTKPRCASCGSFHNPPTAPAHVLTGTRTEYRPLLTFEPKGVLIQVSLKLNGRLESVTDFPLDRYGTNFETGVALSPQIRVGALIDTRRVLKVLGLVLEYEHDSPSGYWSSGSAVSGDGLPNRGMTYYQLRKGSARISFGRYFHIGGGFTLNQWGLGLLANDGSRGWEPGNAQFNDPRGGDRVLRGYLATGPLTRANIQAMVAFDQVRGDDILLNGDKAIQVLGVLQAGFGRPSGGGVFFVHRRLTTLDNKELNVSVVDLAGRVVFDLHKHLRLKLEAELAVVSGSTTLAPTVDHPEHQVLQIGAAGRASLDHGRIGTVCDFLFASGDQNLDDRRSSSFKADPNYPMGMLLFRYVSAAQSARATVTSADPQLVGAPSQNLERFPTRGSASNTVAFYPKLWARPVAGLEFYGGVLVAWAVVPNSDPFNSRIAGGQLRNALDGPAGRFYGAEFNLGARYRMILHGTQLTLGVEGASLVTGDAFRTVTGTNMANVLGGRVMLEYRL